MIAVARSHLATSVYKLCFCYYHCRVFFWQDNKLELELELELAIYTEHLLATTIDRQWLRHVNGLLGRH